MENCVTNPAYDVVAIGNAIVDILATTDDAFIAEEGMTKGSMQLMFSPQEADALYAKMGPGQEVRSEEHTSELQSLMRISYAVFCLTKKTHTNKTKQLSHQVI